MDSENRYLSSTIEKFNIDTLVDLSILDLITLELLIKKREPVVRYSLYVEVEEFFKESKEIPSSSFYNNLLNLEKKGFIAFSSSKNKKSLISQGHFNEHCL
jgi:DNA-binding PadR family transcriptional regulator